MHAPRAASRAPQGGGARGDYNALAALPLPKRSEWRCIGNDTAIGLIQPFGAPSVRRLEIRSSNVPPAVAELALAAAAEGGRVPIVLGPPAGGEAQAGGLTAAFQGDGRLVVNSAPLIRLARAAATKLGAPVAVVLRAEPEQRRCRVWLAAPGSTGAALEAGELPEGVVQLSEGAKESDSVAAAAAPVPRPPEARTLVANLEAVAVPAIISATNTTNATNTNPFFPPSLPVAQPPTLQTDKYRLEFDGGSRGNHGAAGFGWAIVNHNTGKIIKQHGARLPGRATNNVAEYQGLINGLEAALNLGVRCVWHTYSPQWTRSADAHPEAQPRRNIMAQGDSELVVRQVIGRYQARRRRRATRFAVR